MKAWGKRLALITIAVLIVAITINMFLGPHHIAAGGVGGISILLDEAFGISRFMTTIVLNSILLLVGAVLLGKEFFINTVIGSTLLPFAIAVIPERAATSDKLLSAIVASVLIAISVTILYRIQASSGGTSIPPLILKKYTGISTTVGLLLTDALVVVMNIAVFNLEAFLYALLVVVLVSLIMSLIESFINRKRAIYIISDDYLKMIEVIQNRVSRGITLVPTIGAYTRQQKEMLMIVVEEKDVRKVQQIVDSVDPRAFVIVHMVSDVRGLGFSYHSVSI